MTFKNLFLTFLALVLIWNIGLPLLGFGIGVLFKLIRVVLVVSCVAFGVRAGREIFRQYKDSKSNS